MSLHSLLHTSDAIAHDTAPGLAIAEFTKPPLDVGEQADCCCATAQVRVVLPPVAGRSSRPELRLCAHHYRESAARLTAAGADVYDSRGHWIPAHETYWVDAEPISTPAQQLV